MEVNCAPWGTPNPVLTYCSRGLQQLPRVTPIASGALSLCVLLTPWYPGPSRVLPTLTQL